MVMQSFHFPSTQLSSPGSFTCGRIDAKVNFLLNNIKSTHQPGITNSVFPYQTSGEGDEGISAHSSPCCGLKHGPTADWSVPFIDGRKYICSYSESQL